MSEEFEDLYSAYYEAEVPMSEKLNSSGLTPEQIVVLGQLAPAIVDGRTASAENARRIVGNVFAECRRLGISEDLIDQFQAFGNEWADKLYPRL